MSQQGCLSLPNPRVAVNDRLARFRFLVAPLIDGEALTAEIALVLAEADSGAGARPSMLIAFTGTLASGRFEPDMRNWLGAGRDALARAVERATALAEIHGVRVGIIPHFAHLLSDLPGQMRLWHEHSARGLATVLSPATLIAPSMMRDADEHFARAIEVCAARCDLCLLEDLRSPATPDDAPTRVAWGEGELAHDRIAALLAATLPPSVPIAT